VKIKAITGQKQTNQMDLVMQFTMSKQKYKINHITEYLGKEINNCAEICETSLK
jgi:hypothetical protein